MSCFPKISTSGQEYGPYCGSVAPGRIDTGSYQVHIVFMSDASGSNKGWKIRYSSTKADWLNWASRWLHPRPKHPPVLFWWVVAWVCHHCLLLQFSMPLCVFSEPISQFCSGCYFFTIKPLMHGKVRQVCSLWCHKGQQYLPQASNSTLLLALRD